MIEQILNKKPLNGLITPLDNVRLRIGIIDNPTINRAQGTQIDPLNPVSIVNMSSGKVTIRWIDSQGGVIRSPDFAGQTQATTHQNVGDHGTVADVTSDSSEREMITLTHPMIWANDKRWFGINYLPPVGSVVIVGFRKQNLPVILGYLQSNYSICHPIKLGEMMLKGYGNNYIYMQQSDRIEMHTWSVKGDVDLLDPAKSKKNEDNCDIYIKFNSNDQILTISASNSNSSSQITVQPSQIEMQVGSSNFSMNSSSMDFTASNINFHGTTTGITDYD